MGLMITIPVKGEITFKHRRQSPSLEEVQKIIGGYVQLIKIKHQGEPAQLLCDEDGIAKDLPINVRSTSLMLHQPVVPMMMGGLRGTIVILQGEDTVWT